MSVYFLAQFNIRDRTRYDRYAARFMPILLRHGGRLLAADESPERIEGHWSGDKVVLIAFDDAAAAERWLRSADYQEIAVDRVAATVGNVLRIQGLDIGMR